MYFNPLSAILKENKLEGQNYIEWKQNLDIVLTAEEYKFVLTTPRPAVPAANCWGLVPLAQRKTCTKQINQIRIYLTDYAINQFTC